ncbi:hypothetical protein T4B_12344 [Trichinella pseudospiralis]|nr:hypothetical protein T4B_12344 [Trichinella pseudospiralis]
MVCGGLFLQACRSFFALVSALCPSGCSILRLVGFGLYLQHHHVERQTANFLAGDTGTTGAICSHPVRPIGNDDLSLVDKL